MAMDIILNAKTQRIGVCNACESLVIHEKIADTFLPELMKRLAEKNVEVHGDEKVMQIAGEGCMKRELLVPATEEDWGREYLVTNFLRRQFPPLMRPLPISINITQDIPRQSSQTIIPMRRSS